jgi:hypothetical protein
MFVATYICCKIVRLFRIFVRKENNGKGIEINKFWSLFSLIHCQAP